MPGSPKIPVRCKPNFGIGLCIFGYMVYIGLEIRYMPLRGMYRSLFFRKRQ